MISGRLVTLRPVEDSDHEAIRDWQNEPEVWWWQDYEQAFSLADIAESEEHARREGGEWHDRLVMSVQRNGLKEALKELYGADRA